MLTIVVVMLLIVVLAGAVLVYVAFPHRGEETPGAPWLGQALGRFVQRIKTTLTLTPEESRAEPRDSVSR